MLSVSGKLTHKGLLEHDLNIQNTTQCKQFIINELSYSRHRDHPPETLFRLKTTALLFRTDSIRLHLSSLHKNVVERKQETEMELK
jgi:hypothetical protein